MILAQWNPKYDEEGRCIAHVSSVTGDVLWHDEEETTVEKRMRVLEERIAMLEQSKERGRIATQKWVEDLNAKYLWETDRHVTQAMLSHILSEIILGLND